MWMGVRSMVVVSVEGMATNWSSPESHCSARALPEKEGEDAGFSFPKSSGDNSEIGDPLLCLNEIHFEKSSGMHQMKENFRMEEILAWFLNKLGGILALRGISFHLQLRNEAFLTALLLKVNSKLCKKISGSLW